MTETQEGTRTRLLDAALEVLLEHGSAQATTRRIAAAAGVNLQAITYHFGSKDALIAQALVHAVRRWTAPARAALDGVGEDPLGRLSATVAALRDGLATARPYLPAYLEALAVAARSEQARAEVLGVITELRTALAEAIGALRAAGHLAAWVDPEPMAALIVAAGDGVVLHAALDPDYPVDAALGQVVQLLLAAAQGLTGPDAAASAR